MGLLYANSDFKSASPRKEEREKRSKEGSKKETYNVDCKQKRFDKFGLSPLRRLAKDHVVENTLGIGEKVKLEVILLLRNQRCKLLRNQRNSPCCIDSTWFTLRLRLVDHFSGISDG